jgi:hypothetical protein
VNNQFCVVFKSKYVITCGLVLLFAFSGIFHSMSLKAQAFHDFGFERKTNIPVYGFDEKLLDLAWTGGLNNCQFHKFDLNFNGIEDLIIFDRHGNRLLTFLNDGSEGEYAYSFAPEYIDYFPAVEHWIQFHDFNNNGKKDIFTYIVGGIKAFKNVSETEIKFEQITFPYLTSLYGNIQTNLLVTNVDYPAIVDMDGDGDLDILTFWGLGTFLEKHTNKSMEYYGHADTLVYEKTDYCWGWFAESDESNVITLDTCLFLKNHALPVHVNPDGERHTGSTLLMLDMTGNGLNDLILGDIDYPGLILLMNGGTQDSAYITGIDTLFPSNTRPVDLFSMPAAHFIDVTNNGINDLVVSPFEPSLRRAKHHDNTWFYKNTGTNELPVFEFEREDLFQHRMIDVGAGSMPVFADINNNGLPDLFVANFGYNDTCFYDPFYNLQCKYVSQLAFYKNTGTPGNPVFTLIDDDVAGLSELGLRSIYPAFADIYGDGNIEMIIGHADGGLMLFKDISDGKGFPEFALVDDDFQNIKVSGFSTPQLIDLNGNGLFDLVIGQQNGKISYYRNQGSNTIPQFIRVSDELGGVNVTDPFTSYTGHSIPHFFHDTENILRLFVGSESGRIFYFNYIENNLDGNFTLAEERLLLIREGIRTAPATAYLSGNEFPDMVIGNYSGGLSFYQGTLPKPFGIKDFEVSKGKGFDVFPNPASSIVMLVLDREENVSASLEVFDMTGRLVHKEINLVNRQMIIPVDEWNRGLYIFRVKFTANNGSQQIGMKKVIITK